MKPDRRERDDLAGCVVLSAEFIDFMVRHGPPKPIDPHAPFTKPPQQPKPRKGRK